MRKFTTMFIGTLLFTSVSNATSWDYVEKRDAGKTIHTVITSNVQSIPILQSDIIGDEIGARIEYSCSDGSESFRIWIQNPTIHIPHDIHTVPIDEDTVVERLKIRLDDREDGHIEIVSRRDFELQYGLDLDRGRQQPVAVATWVDVRTPAEDMADILLKTSETFALEFRIHYGGYLMPLKFVFRFGTAGFEDAYWKARRSCRLED